MKFRLPFLGEVLSGKDALPQPVPKKEKDMVLGTFLDLGQKTLSNEKTISSKLIDAFYEWVYVNVTALAEEVSKLEPELYRVDIRGGQYELTEIETHPILDLLDRFNDTTTKTDGFYLTQSHLELAGDAFWYLENGDNQRQPSNIYLLQPDKIELQLGDISAGANRLVNGFLYKTTLGGETITQSYAYDEVLHFKVPNPKNPYRGFSVVEGIANSLDIDTNTLKAARSFYENGMMAQFMLQTDQRLTSDQLKKLRAEMRAAYSGSQNFWKVPIFGGGIKPQQIQMSSRDAQMIDQQAWLRDKIMAAFKNTKASIGITEDVNRANAEATLLGWKRSVIKPKLQRIVDNLNEFLVPRYGDNLILGFCDPVPEDRTQKIADATALVGAGIMTVNEAREEVGLDQVTGQDQFLNQGMPTLAPGELPKSIQNVNYKSVFRRSGLIEKKQGWLKTYEAAKPIVKQIQDKQYAKQIQLVAEKKTDQKKRFHNDVGRQYQTKQMTLVDETVDRINLKLDQYFEAFTKRITPRIEAKLRKDIVDDEIVDPEEEKKELSALLVPVLAGLAGAAGSAALQLINLDKPFVLSDPQYEYIRNNVDKFATSLLSTDKDKLTNIINAGINAGNGPAVIARDVTSEFSQFTKMQSERIARSESLRTLNHFNIEAWKTTDIVVGKQWLCDANPCEWCEPLNGTELPLEDNYFDIGDTVTSAEDAEMLVSYLPIEGGELHPNCACTVVPVLKYDMGGAGAAIMDDNSPLPRIYRGEDYSGNDNLSLGYGTYFSRTKSIAQQYGTVSSYKLDIRENQLLKINTDEQYEALFKAAIRKAQKLQIDLNQAIPKVVLARGYKGAEIAETLDPNGGIAIYDQTLLPKALQKAEVVDVTKDNELEELKAYSKELEKMLDIE
jgi:HK97 family phage portal protein